MSSLGILFMRRGIQSHPTAGSDHIRFRDEAVAEICIANFSTDGVGVTRDDAAAVTSLGGKFKGNTAITSFDELEYFGVKILAASEFNGCTNLQSINLSNIEGIGASAFVGCDNLQNINSDLSNATSIGANAFDGCTNLFIDEINAVQLASLGNYAFRGVNVTRWATTGRQTSFNSYAATYGVVSEMMFGDAITATTFPRGYYDGNTTLAKLRIPNAVTAVNAYACRGCANLKEVQGLEHVKSTGVEAFSMAALEGHLDLSSLQTSGNSDFSDTNITSINLPSIVTMAQQFVARSPRLVKVEIGESVTTMSGRWAFIECPLLTAIIVRATTPPAGSNNMLQDSPNAIIYVPDESVDAYKASWTAYASRIQPLSSYSE